MDSWTVYLSRKAYKQLGKLPRRIQDLADLAIMDMEGQGVRPQGWDVKKTADDEYRLRITYRYRMRYQLTTRRELEIEIFYVGHRREAYR